MHKIKTMQKKLHIKKGDAVIVIAGNYKGREGKVLEVIRATEKAIVEGVNMVKKHTKPNATHPQGGIVEKEAPIHISEPCLIYGYIYSRVISSEYVLHEPVTGIYLFPKDINLVERLRHRHETYMKTRKSNQ